MDRRRGPRGAWWRAWRAAATAIGVLAVATFAALAIAVWWPASWSAGRAGASSSGVVAAVGAENEYANVIAQVGGDHVHVTAILRNPSTDPHTFEANPATARLVASAQLVVQNGLGYDSFMTTLERASPNPSREVVDVQALRHLPASTLNPHLWYTPATMPAVARAVADDLAALDPAHRAQYLANAARFDRSLRPWDRAIEALARAEPGAPVATTEPVADYLLAAVGARDRTPLAFQVAVMNGVDPSPQDVAVEQQLLSRREVRAFVYNRQATDTLTESLLAMAKAHGVPVVGVYETMPTPGYTYQSWMTSTVRALRQALGSNERASHS